jgi:hypothetical protein
LEGCVARLLERYWNVYVNLNLRVENVQEFAKSLLDVADNLERALDIVRKSTSTADVEANAKLLNSLFEGVEITEKQLIKVWPCLSLYGSKISCVKSYHIALYCSYSHLALAAHGNFIALSLQVVS